jgi:hypothetical protein
MTTIGFAVPWFDSPGILARPLESHIFTRTGASQFRCSAGLSRLVET